MTVPLHSCVDAQQRPATQTTPASVLRQQQPPEALLYVLLNGYAHFIYKPVHC